MESIERLNYRLVRNYGYFDSTIYPLWRIVWSEDQFENRYGTYEKHDSHGNWIGQYTGFQEVPKYRQYIREKWVLERCMPVPLPNAHELTTKTTYEPVWVFQDKDKNALPPNWEVTLIVIETINK